MSKSARNNTPETPAQKFVRMCMEQHQATPSELLAQSQQDWKRIRRESGLERELKLDTPTHTYNVNKDGTVNFLQPRAAK